MIAAAATDAHLLRVRGLRELPRREVLLDELVDISLLAASSSSSTASAAPAATIASSAFVSSSRSSAAST
ncbi:MAG: hypothetical protein U0470_06900 [Anaerolineae bacterium]